MYERFAWIWREKTINLEWTGTAQNRTIQKKMVIVSYAFWLYESAIKMNIQTMKLNPIENKRQIANRRFNGI